MAKYKVIRAQTGLVNGQPWPGAGEIIEIDADLSAMVEAGDLEQVEKRPAVTKRVETRKAKD